MDRRSIFPLCPSERCEQQWNNPEYDDPF